MGGGQAGATCAPARVITLDRGAAIREIPKEPRYTQGLVMVDGVLYEGSGYWEHSGVYRIDRRTGRSTEIARLDDRLFGEGLAELGDRLYQLTWRSGLAFVYDLEAGPAATLPTPRTIRHGGEGWGLTAVDARLVLSDGSSRLKVLDPEDFSVEREIAVTYGGQPVDRLNELETVDDLILANLYGDSHIVAIDPTDGCVRAVIDARRLVAEVQKDLARLRNPVCGGPCASLDFVLNGIAYDPESAELYLTGKNWPLILVFANPIALAR